MDKFSYSKLSCYQSCGYQYKLIYVDKHFINDSAIATDFGTTLHHTEELIARDIQNSIPLDYSKYINVFLNGDEHCKGMNEIAQTYPEAYFDELDKSSRTYDQKVREYLDDGIYRLEKFMKENPSYEIIGIEEEFNINYQSKYTFHGFIDRVFRDKSTGKIIIEDIKTYAKPIDDASLVTPLQFVFYVLAMQEKYPNSEIECAYDLPLVGIKQKAGTEGFINRGLKKIDKLLDKIENEEFVPNPSPLCHWCQFSKTNPNQPEEGKNLCPYYSLWTKTNKVFQSEFYWQGVEKHPQILKEFIEKETKINKQKEMTSGNRIINIRIRR